MDDQQRFRRALPDEARLLNEMTLAGVRHWGHDVNYPEVYEGLVVAVSEDDGFANATINVLEEKGEIIAFYDLRDRGDHIELLRMFQRTDLIGRGYGRKLWEHCVATASRQADRMLIMSDPGAGGFYEAMGAELETTQEVAPGFSLGVYWVDLN